MVEQVSLDNSSYDGIYERARERLLRQAPWWEHTEVSDPGITLLEMWAMLADMQSFYIDQVQESHYRKYLKLLGISPDEGGCAWVWLFLDKVEEDCILPAGTKLLADSMVFETEEERLLVGNRITGFYQGNEKNLVRAINLSRKSSFVLSPAEDGVLFSIVLGKPLTPEQNFFLFVLLDEKNERNPAEAGFYMAQLTWEYETGTEWREAETARDDTCGLLYSGFICLRTDMPMQERTQGGYEIRCRIREGAYDVPPTLYKICLNVVKAVQRNTLCGMEEMEFSHSCREVSLKSYLARTGQLWILRRRETGEADEDLWEDITKSPDVKVESFVTAGCPERHLTYKGEGHVRVVYTVTEAALADFTKEVTGVAAQQIALPWDTLMRESVEIMLKQENGLYRTYRRAEPEDDRYENAWHWLDEENTIVLGDGRHGEIPPYAKDGLRICSLALWEGEKGNVSVGRITKWENPAFASVTCTNPLAGRAGRERPLPSEQFQTVRKMLAEQNRMLTEEDIKKIVKKTPGLRIGRAEVKWKEGAIAVRVFPVSPLQDAYCMEKYRKQVEAHLERYRVAGTAWKVEIRNR